MAANIHNFTCIYDPVSTIMCHTCGGRSNDLLRGYPCRRLPRRAGNVVATARAKRIASDQSTANSTSSSALL